MASTKTERTIHYWPQGNFASFSLVTSYEDRPLSMVGVFHRAHSSRCTMRVVTYESL
ncbi:hypothetical protein K443DRAFT_682225 [Laccaria amethystina LaAM-08-1]|uniref:Uncharacterized protein n=1 Tax=Laccaria amethystina LaAM-08-1 TaxID=1095629 RepID=A0A0C9WKS5_9AGAR|nr:hypothetical protein K443DRAFT_682225 [Laccaria amethystina LaAM-08-1]